MRYLSVCSGIEAATVAWHPLGWTPVAFSEIEAFPSAVLAHHYPDVPNYGDMTKHEQWPITRGAIDILVGGTPCQSFSVAGLRKGLRDPRGGLMLTYLEIAQRLRPQWIVWENVPGVLSSGSGRDFGSFLGALGELGYGWAYRVLDAQWCRTHRHPRAVPQRRRRVFVVGYLGDWTAAAAVLFESQSVRRDTAARRATGQGVAADAEGGAQGGCITSHAVAPCLETTSNDYSRADGFTMVAGTLGNRGLRSHTELDGHGAYIPVAIQGNLVGRDTGGPHGVGASTEGSMYTLTKADTHAVAVPIQDGRDIDKHQNGLGVGQPGDPAYTVDTTAAQAIAIGTDCYNGAVTGNVAATMGTPGSSVNASGPTVMTFKPGQSAAARSIGAQENVACTLGAGGGGNNKQAVVHPVPYDLFQITAPVNRQNRKPGDPCHTLARDNAAHAAVAVAPSLTATNDPSRSPQSAEVTQQVAAVHASTMTVRRLTPRECERLQGFPDDYTAIPWRGKAETPDGPRYKALGNSMAVNCMAWIGERIAEVEAQ